MEGLISLTAFVYVIGFVVANSYYVTFGITEYQLIQARYVATGLLYLFFHLGLATVVAVIVFVLRWARWFIWLSAALGLWGFLGMAVYLVTRSMPLVLAVGVNAGVVVVLGYGIWTSWGGNHRTSSGIWLVSRGYLSWFISRGIPKKPLVAFVSVGWVLLVCISAMIWGRSFWPEMNSSLGGGRPNEAVFVFDSENLSETGLPFVPMQTDSISEQLPVLFESSDTFVVLVQLDSKSSTAVHLSKSIVLSVVYAPAGFRGRKHDIPTLTPSPTPTATLTLAPVSTPTSVCPKATPTAISTPAGFHQPTTTVAP